VRNGEDAGDYSSLHHHFAGSFAYSAIPIPPAPSFSMTR